MNDPNARNSSGGNVAAIKRNKPAPAGGKLMRLRSRFRTLHESYLVNGRINERDADVTFVTMDGQKVRGHKLILAAASTFFVSMFADQASGEMTTVMVPDVRGETMRLILQLAYTDSISVTMKQIKEVGSFISLFGMEWKQFNFDGFDDVSPSVSKPPFTVSPAVRQTQSPGVKHITVTPDMVTMNQNFGKTQGRLSKNSIQKSLMQRQKETFRQETNESNNFTFQLQGYGESATGGNNGSSGGKQLPLGIGTTSRLKQQLTAPLYRKTYGNSAPNTSRGAPPRFQGRSDNPRVESNYDGYEGNDTDFHGVNSNNEDAQKMIKEWMSKVGKEESGTPPMKKFRMIAPATKAKVVPRSVTPPLAANQAVNTCTVCHGEFTDKQAWKWHEERHIGLGIFKCGYCNLLFGTTKKLLLHEEILHNSSVPAQMKANLAGNEEEQDSDSGGNVRKRKLIPRTELQEEASSPNPTVPRLKLIKSQHGTQYKSVNPKLKIQKKMALKLKSAATAGKQKATFSKMADIGIGESPGTELMDSRTVKRLHWLYNCLKCDSCSDASSKAIGHYYKCYPDKELPFEKTVVKYRQGFYGKYRCPLCPRRYTSIGGFVIHCGHMHTGYRKKFNQTQSGEIKCTKCGVVFNLPAQFDEHLSGGLCPNSKSPSAAREESSVKGESPSKPKAVGSSKMPRLSSSNSSKMEYENPYDDMLAKRRSQTLTGRSPRSARLANRLINETLAKNSENLDESTFKDIDCPICGADSVKNINHHLTSDHSELGVEVQRLSEDLLRCLKCKLTFAICDLFSHSNSCTGSKEFEFVKQRQVAAVKTSQQPPVVRRKLEIPPGVGCSPIDVMDNPNLCNLETFNNALKCAVCGKVAKKLGVILECMKTHGVHRCALCFNTYLQKADYSAHLKRCHTQGTPNGKIICPICAKISANTGQAASHMYVHHWIPLLRENEQDNSATEVKDTDQTSEIQKGEELTPAADEVAADLSETVIIPQNAEESNTSEVMEDEGNGNSVDTVCSSLQKTSSEVIEAETSKETEEFASAEEDDPSKVKDVDSVEIPTGNVVKVKQENVKASEPEEEIQTVEAEANHTKNISKPEEKE